MINFEPRTRENPLLFGFCSLGAAVEERERERETWERRGEIVLVTGRKATFVLELAKLFMLDSIFHHCRENVYLTILPS